MLPFFDITKLQEIAKSQLGKPYEWGAKPKNDDYNPVSFDCSGFVRWVYGRLGVGLPEGSEQQLLMSKPVQYTLQIGDLGFFIDPVTHASKHVGLILDENTVIEARGHEPSLSLSNQVITRPRRAWEGWHEFSGWRRVGLLY